MLLPKLGHSQQGPMCPADRNDPDGLTPRFRETVETAKQWKFTVFFVDKSGIRSDARLSTTRGPVDVPPLVEGGGAVRNEPDQSGLATRGSAFKRNSSFMKVP